MRCCSLYRVTEVGFGGQRNRCAPRGHCGSEREAKRSVAPSATIAMDGGRRTSAEDRRLAIRLVMESYNSYAAAGRAIGRDIRTVLRGSSTLLVAGSWLPLLVARGGCLGPPLHISRSNGPIFKIQTAFDSAQRVLHL